MLSNWKDIWKSSEEILQGKLKNNPYYPFTIRQPNVYEFHYLNDNLNLGIVLIFTSFCGSILSFLTFFLGNTQMAGLFIFTLLLGLWLVLTSFGRRSLIIDLNENEYEFHIHHRLEHKGGLDEIYIRLRSQKTGQGVLYYRLTLNGPHIELLNLTGIKLTQNAEKLEKLGLRLAMKLSLNYFDCFDVSTKHNIKHWPH